MSAERSGQVILRCPVAHLEYLLGVQMDESSFRSLPDVALSARCPHCREPHTWRPSQARIDYGPLLPITAEAKPHQLRRKSQPT